MIGIGMDGVFLMLSAWSRSELVSRDLVTRMTITAFGAFLAISGHLEHSNRHCLLLAKVESKSMAEKSSWFYWLLLAGGTSQADPGNARDNKDEKMMLFFKNIVTPCLNWKPTKLFIIVVFAFYLAVS